MKKMIVILSFIVSFQVSAAQQDCPRLVVESYVSAARTQDLIGSFNKVSSGRCLDLTIDSQGGHPEAVASLLNTLEKFQAAGGMIQCQIVNELKGTSMALLPACNVVAVTNDAKVVLSDNYGYYEGPWNGTFYESKKIKVHPIDIALHQKLKDYLNINEAQYTNYKNRSISGKEFAEKLLVIRSSAH